MVMVMLQEWAAAQKALKEGYANKFHVVTVRLPRCGLQGLHRGSAWGGWRDAVCLHLRRVGRPL